MKLRILALFALLACAAYAEKRPITHKDYDRFRHIQNQHLSNHGHYLAYAVFPQEGDGELVVRNLVTGKEWREPIGELPPPPAANFAEMNPDAPPPTRGITVAFSRDSRTLVVSTFPPRAEVEKAKRDKKKPEAMPKNGMVIMDLASGSVTRVSGVKSFQVPAKGDGWVAFLRESENPASEAAPIQANSNDTSRPARKQEFGS